MPKIKKLPKRFRFPEEGCAQCILHKTRTNVCPGTGPGKKSPLIFVGEGPGKEEDLSGVVFVAGLVSF